MEGGTTLATILTMVGDLTGGLGSMFTSLSTNWFVFLPMAMMVFGFLFGAFKSLLFFRKRRRR